MRYFFFRLLPYTIDFDTDNDSTLLSLTAPPNEDSKKLASSQAFSVSSKGLLASEAVSVHESDPGPSPANGSNKKSSPIPDLKSLAAVPGTNEKKKNTSVKQLFFSKPTGAEQASVHDAKHVGGEDESSTGSNLPPIFEQPIYHQVKAKANPKAPKNHGSSTKPAPTKNIVGPRKEKVPLAPPSVKIERRKTMRSRHNTLNSPVIRGHSRPLSSSTIIEDSKWTVELQSGGNGGLRNAVNRAKETQPDLSVEWFGNLGLATDFISDSTKAEITQTLEGDQYKCHPVFVNDETFDGHYTHYCKQILWPTFHYEVPDNPKSKAYEDHSWEHYRALNQAVADEVVKNHVEGSTIWVNDYHLLLVPKMIRDKLPHAKIALFLHVPFPSSEVFRCLATRKQLLEGMLGANCIGFQIEEYVRHFLQTCNRILAADTEVDGVWQNDRFILTTSMSIGIDPESLDVHLADPKVAEWRELLRQSWPKDQVKLIVSRDKLDKIKGVKQKLLAYEEFLKQHPEYISKVVLVQACLSDVGDPELEHECTHIVDRINSMKKDLAACMPVVFHQQDLSFQQYLALLSEADAFAVTSLREGMNLTCHEFIYCNDPSIMGPLILSEFTGSASIIGEKCILVNPWDKRQVADAFYEALTMSQEDRQDRWTVLHNYVRQHTCLEWMNGFLQEAEESWQSEQDRNANKGRSLDVGSFLGSYRWIPRAHQGASKRMFFLDLDSAEMLTVSKSSIASASSSPTQKSGLLSSQHNSSTNLSHLNRVSSYRTLDTILGSSAKLERGAATARSDRGPGASTAASSSISPTTAEVIKTANISGSANVSPQRKILVLSELTSDPRNLVYVTSRDSRQILDRMYGRVPHIGLIAESGAFLKLAGTDAWLSFADQQKTAEWQGMVVEVLESVSERVPGVSITKTDTSVSFYVNQLLEQDQERASSVIGECISHINDAFSRQHIRARFKDNSKVVITDLQLCRVAAAKRAFEAAINQGVDVEFLCIATRSDEDVDDADRLNEWADGLAEDHIVKEVFTISLGNRPSNAKWSLGGVNSVLNVIKTATK